jgi:hypothetical protein
VLLSLREQQDLYMAAANKKGVLKLQRAFKDMHVENDVQKPLNLAF